MLPIGAENLPPSLYTPLVVLLAIYALLALLAARARGREDRDRTDRFETIAFGVLLVAALYTIVLVISAVFSYPSRSTDMVTIILVICGFFALLLFAFFVLAELIPRRLRGRRATTTTADVERADS
jgi:TRAP-type C4-dicarboxylate transport system permease large subunit